MGLYHRYAILEIIPIGGMPKKEVILSAKNKNSISSSEIMAAQKIAFPFTNLKKKATTNTPEYGAIKQGTYFIYRLNKVIEQMDVKCKCNSDASPYKG